MKQRFAGKNLLVFLLIAALPFFWSCGGGGGGKSIPEATLTVTTTPAVNSTQAASVGPFNLNVTITSAMPAKGVTIAVSAAPDGSSTNFFSTSKSSTTASNDFIITATPVAVTSVVKITVTSNSTSTNTWTGSYRYSAK